MYYNSTDFINKFHDKNNVSFVRVCPWRTYALEQSTLKFHMKKYDNHDENTHTSKVKKFVTSIVFSLRFS